MYKKLTILPFLLISLHVAAVENPFLDFFSTLFGYEEVEKVSSKYNCAAPLEAPANAIVPLRDGIWFESDLWPSGILPTLDDDVFIPSGMTITMAGMMRAQSITVEGTLRAVNHQAEGAWINLSTKYILVNGSNALFEIGTTDNSSLKRQFIPKQF